jgi:hypothetical protein
MGAYISQIDNPQGTDGEELTYDLSGLTYEAGDYLLMLSSVVRGGTGEIDTKPVGWTDVVSQGITGVSGWVGYLKATSSSETNPTIGHATTGDVYAQVLVIKGADPTTFIDVSTSSTTSNIRGGNLPSITTTANGELVIVGISSNDNEDIRTSAVLDQYPINQRSAIQLGLGLTCFGAWAFVQDTAGATPSNIEYYGEIDSNIIWALSIKNASGNSEQIQVSSDISNVYLGSHYEEYQGTGNNVSDLNGVISTLDSKTVVSITPSVDHTVNPSATAGSRDNITWANPVGAAANTYEGVIITLDSSKDIDALPVSLVYEHNTYGFIDNSNPLTIIFFDSSGNWEAFYAADIPPAYPSGTDKRIFINPSSSTAYASSGTIDYTDIDRFALAFLMDGTGTSARNIEIRGMLTLQTTTFTGGNSTKQITPRELAETISKRSMDVDLSFSQGIGQDAFAFPIQIGDGTTPTYYSQKASSMEWRAPDKYLRVNPSEFPLRVYASASDTYENKFIRVGTALQHLVVFPRNTINRFLNLRLLIRL